MIRLSPVTRTLEYTTILDDGTTHVHTLQESLDMFFRQTIDQMQIIAKIINLLPTYNRGIYNDFIPELSNLHSKLGLQLFDIMYLDDDEYIWKNYKLQSDAFNFSKTHYYEDGTPITTDGVYIDTKLGRIYDISRVPKLTTKFATFKEAAEYWGRDLVQTYIERYMIANNISKPKTLDIYIMEYVKPYDIVIEQLLAVEKNHYNYNYHPTEHFGEDAIGNNGIPEHDNPSQDELAEDIPTSDEDISEENTLETE